jgi:hypothetical protein
VVGEGEVREKGNLFWRARARALPGHPKTNFKEKRRNVACK